MKAYKFMAQYKKSPEDKFKDFEEYLYLWPDEVAMAKENTSKFLLLQMRKAALPDGIYDKIWLGDWKTKKRFKSTIRKRVNWIKSILKSKRNR